MSAIVHVVRVRQFDVVISALTIVEMASVLRRRHTEAASAPVDAREFYRRFVGDASRFEVVSIDEELITRAGELLLEGVTGARVRSSDAIQLATARWWFEQVSALNIESGAFVVADHPLRDAALALGLPVENPEDRE